MYSRVWSRVVLVCTLVMAGTSVSASAQSFGPLNVKSLPTPCQNAVGNGTTDDTAAFTCAIGKVSAQGGGEIYIPAGRYKLTHTLTITNKNITLRGDGQRISNLLWFPPTEGGTNGIEFVSDVGAVNHTLNVRSLSLIATHWASAAISGTWQTPTDQNPYGGTSAHIFDVHISRMVTQPPPPAEPGPAFWEWGIRLTNAQGARIHAFNIDGQSQWVGSAAIQVEGKSLGVSINDGNLGRYQFGVHVLGQSESIRLENIETSENVHGYLFEATGKGYTIANCHAGVMADPSGSLNVKGTGIRFTNGSNIVIADNFTLFTYTGIDVTHADTGNSIVIRGNRTAQTVRGIHLQGPITQALIIGNTTPDASTASIVLGPGVTYSYVVANSLFGHAPVSNHVSNQIAGNKP